MRDPFRDAACSTLAAGEAPQAVKAAPVPAAASSRSAADTTVTAARSAANNVQASADTDGQTQSSVTVGGKDVTAKDGWTWTKTTDADGGEIMQLGLVNFDQAGADIVSSGVSGLNIAVAGFNHVRSIVSEGDVNVVGTGILLMDSVELGEGTAFYLQTQTDLYADGTGSAAVFLRQDDGTYLLVNGGVPGILDEEYTVTGVDLVMPGGTKLLLNTTGRATDNETGKVIIYHSYEEAVAEGVKSNTHTAQESSGVLTIGDGASLTVENGAEIVTSSMSHLNKTGTQNSQLSIVGKNAKLVLDGTVSGSGDFDVGNAVYNNVSDDVWTVIAENSAFLTGNGELTVKNICFSSPDTIRHSNVTIRSNNVQVRGTGDVGKLVIDDSRVSLGDGITGVGEIVSSGNSSVSLNAPSRVSAMDISGTLTLHSRKSCLNPDKAITLDGAVTASEGSSATLDLNSGNYTLSDGFRLSSGIKLTGGFAYVYDLTDHDSASADPDGAYADIPVSLSAPVFISPAEAGKNAPEAVNDENGQLVRYDVQAIIVTAIEGAHGFGWDSSVSAAEPFLFPVYPDEQGEYIINLNDETRYPGGKIPVPDGWIVYELDYLDADGSLRRVILDDNADLSGIRYSAGDGLYQIRIYLYKAVDITQSGSSIVSTNTSFTGSGILGSSGSAGGGRSSSLILRGTKKPENHDDPAPVDPDPEPGPVTPDPEPDPEPTPAQQTDWHVIVTPAGEYRTVRVYYGARDVADPGTKVTARFRFTLPAGWNKNCVFAVFRSDDGSLTAFRATYDEQTGMLSFDTDLTGIFALVSFSFDGELYSEEFYEALEALDEIRDLPVRR